MGHKKWRLDAIHAPPPLITSVVEEEATQPTPEKELVTPPHLASLPPSKLTSSVIPSTFLPHPLSPRKSPLPTPSPESPPHGTPSAGLASPSNLVASPISKAPQAAPKVVQDDDSMDVIPDSEPPRTDLPVSERRLSPPRQPPLPRVPEIEQETIPDSWEEEQLKEPSAPPVSPMAVDRELGEFVESPKELVELPEPEEPDESLEEPEDDEAPVATRSNTTRRTSGRVRNLAVYTENSDSDSDSEPLAKTAEKLVTPPSVHYTLF